MLRDQSTFCVKSVDDRCEFDELFNGILGSGVPDGFEVFGHTSRGEELDRAGFFGVAIKAASQLATGNPQEQISKRQWEEGGITLGLTMYGTPRRTRTTDARYVVWGLYKAAERVAEAGSYRGIFVQLKWQGIGVGTLGFYKTEPLSLPEISNLGNVTQDLDLPMLSNSTGGISPGVETVNTTTLAASQLTYQIVQLDPGQVSSHELDLGSLFLTMLLLMVEATKHAPNDPIIVGFNVAIENGQVKAGVSGPETSKPLATPPYFLFTWLCQGLGQATPDLLDKSSIFAFRLKLSVDRVEIGNIEFVQQISGTSTITEQ